MHKILKNTWIRHLIVGILALLITYLFWLSRPTWSADMRFWRAVGDGGFILLFLTLVIGPLVRLFPKIFTKFMSWRKELGIWTALLALSHTYLILDGWVQWDIMRFLGYEFIPELDMYSRADPGFGLANIVGLFALFFLIILLATSSTKAINFLGAHSWKYLQYTAIMVFYLTIIHVGYFLFMHFTFTFHAKPPPPNWFQYPFLTLALLLPLLQMAGFIKTVQKHRRKMSQTTNS